MVRFFFGRTLFKVEYSQRDHRSLALRGRLPKSCNYVLNPSEFLQKSPHIIDMAGFLARYNANEWLGSITRDCLGKEALLSRETGVENVGNRAY